MRASSHDTIKSRYPQEVRERVVRLVFEYRDGVPLAVGGDHLSRRKLRDVIGDAPFSSI